MRRGKFSKGIMVIGLIFTCTVQFFGCGSKERTENGQGVQESRTEPEFVYVAKHQEFGINGKLGEACPVGDAVYFLAGGETGQKGDVEWQAYSLKTEGVTPALFPLEMEEGSFVSSLCADAEKNLFAVVCRRTDRDANYFLTCYTPEGALVFQTDITELGRNDAYFYIQHMAVDKEGNVYLCSGGSVDDFSTIWIFDGEGSRIGKLPCETWVDALFMLPNGNMAAAMQEEGGACFKEIDAAKETFVKTYGNLPEVCSYGAVLSDHVVLLAGRDQVCQYDLEAEHFEELANWADCDVDGSGISGFGIMEDGRLLAVCQKRSTEEAKAELVYLEKKTPAEAAEAKKELIVLGVMFEGDMGISDAVLRFNQTNETYRIEVVSYGEEDYEAGKLRLDAELVSGSGPDLVRIDHDSMRAYAEQGILEDLYPYIDGEIHSFVSDIIDQQKLTNRLISMYDWILRASAKGVLLFPEGSLPDGVDINEIADEWGRFNGVIVYRPRAGVPLPQQVSSKSADIGITELLEIQMKMMEDISGVNGALQGKLESNSMSGTLYNQQTQNSLTALADLLRSFDDFVMQATHADVANMLRFYTRDVIRDITGESVGNGFNQLNAKNVLKLTNQ